jgi:integrase
MPRRKPQGWPKYMVAKRISGGRTAYYWAPPTWALKDGCPLTGDALGTDYGEAKRRCDEIHNPQFCSWRTGGEVGDAPGRNEVGTFDWMAALFRQSPKFSGLPPMTRRSYDAKIKLISDYKLKDGRHFGAMVLRAITAGVVDKLFDKLLVGADGKERRRSVIYAMAVARRAWNVARRSSDLVPLANPFEGMQLSYTAKPTRPVTREELVRFVQAADASGFSSIGTAAMISFYWLLRRGDCLGLAWGAYRPSDAPDIARLRHHKTGEPVDVPLRDDDGTPLFPELCDRLDATTRVGSLIVMREPRRGRNVHVPWNPKTFAKREKAIRDAAGLDQGVTFMGLRHGGLTEGANAGLSDAQMRALSGHRTTAALLRYSQATSQQRKAGARMRRDRTKRDDLSE